MTRDELTRTSATDQTQAAGWRLVLDSLVATVPVTSLPQAVQVAGTVASVADEALVRLDLRADRVDLSVQDATGARVDTGLTQRAVDTTLAISAALDGLGLAVAPAVQVPRPGQRLEICVDAMDIPAVRPFWRAVLGLTPEPGHDEPTGALVDPAWQLPAVWFQQLDEPRTQRNRIHFDISVAHDEARARIDATLAAGGRIVSDAEAPAFWIMADAEGNEVCICTWQARDQ